MDEFKYFVKTGNAHLRDLPPEILEEIIERSDWDQNRYIDFDEFLRMVSVILMFVQHNIDTCVTDPRLNE